jgi:hypothetical protein
MKLLTSNAKLKKSLEILGIETLGVQMTPGAGVCVNYRRCIKDCLAYSGMAFYQNVRESRDSKKDWFIKDEPGFRNALGNEISDFATKKSKKAKGKALRLNVLSDIWFLEEHELATSLGLVCYDYTKDPQKLSERYRATCHVTWSYDGSPESEEIAKKYLEKGGNVAVVFENELPQTFWGYRVVDGDQHDYRPSDPAGSVVGLVFKRPTVSRGNSKRGLSIVQESNAN